MKKIYMKPLIEVIYAACQESILQGSGNDHADAKPNNNFVEEDMEEEWKPINRNLWDD